MFNFFAYVIFVRTYAPREMRENINCMQNYTFTVLQYTGSHLQNYHFGKQE